MFDQAAASGNVASFMAYTLADLQALGRERAGLPLLTSPGRWSSTPMCWCTSADLSSCQYPLDPKVGSIVYKGDAEGMCRCFDEMHNIDNHSEGQFLATSGGLSIFSLSCRGLSDSVIDISKLCHYSSFAIRPVTDHFWNSQPN
ncbi:hypothetical protein PR202_gb24919 [Eleusine coracana subsp. coracana]|uniref:Uncharacterized protein n=1 Tax=Eleusine coracana subsp. coracana TaxID=191504 RepID=A0AAV5FMW8_ELECO|nr:hypothetical protein PR202_gb24919 [Eleusine coracana subsp. coracana]